MSRTTRWLFTVAIVAVTTVAAVAVGNHMWVGRPVSAAIANDSRNAKLKLTARLAWWMQTGTLVLDLKRVDGAAPLDLARILFQSAEALHERERGFERIVLARAGKPVFVIQGSDFRQIGQQRALGENPVYMLRKLPAMLFNPDGTQAYGEWSGGLLGVLSREMEDLNDATKRWVSGRAQ